MPNRTVLDHGLEAINLYGFGEMLRLAVIHNDFEYMFGMLVLDLYRNLTRAQQGRVIKKDVHELKFTHVRHEDGKIEKIGGSDGDSIG